jgi:hypothetical protein
MDLRYVISRNAFTLFSLSLLSKFKDGLIEKMICVNNTLSWPPTQVLQKYQLTIMSRRRLACLIHRLVIPIPFFAYAMFSAMLQTWQHSVLFREEFSAADDCLHGLSLTRVDPYYLHTSCKQ